MSENYEFISRMDAQKLQNFEYFVVLINLN